MNFVASILFISSSILFFFISTTVAVVAVNGTFSVSDFKAVSNGKVDSTAAFADTWTAACNYTGPTAKFVVPKGAYLVGPVAFSGPCTAKMVIQIDGRIIAPAVLKTMPEKPNNWIMFERLAGMLITGNGSFNGMGADTWPKNKRNGKVFPTNIQFSFINDSTVEGISSIDSRMFHIMVYKCVNLKLTKLTITAPETSPNTDGVHIGLSDGVTITDTAIKTGDDCVSIGPTNSRITVTGVKCGPGHGISVGSLGKYKDDKDVTDILVKTCKFHLTMNGVRIKTWSESFPLICKNYTFDDIIMSSVENPIIIDQQYCPAGNCPKTTSSKVKITDIKFSNIKGTSTLPVAIKLLCSKSNPCTGLSFEKIQLKNKVGGAVANSTCENVVKPTIIGVVKPALNCTTV
ncbi:Polygalacturonase, family GH28 [Zostera marina]|uniref:Exopolygalacturonase n=1 Tax=Zostera marina TaxID=29655 RepID=A0A0K9PBF7_ZOSMR|nr:Polygalacturonase, family GH28 [Zostera marina]